MIFKFNIIKRSKMNFRKILCRNINFILNIIKIIKILFKKHCNISKFILYIKINNAYKKSFDPSFNSIFPNN